MDATGTARTLLVLAGWGQLALAAGSLAIPRILGWREEMAKLRPLTRQVFRTYATYIWATNVGMGLLSCLAPGWLLAASPLGRAVSGYIALYWGARLGIQLFVYDRSDAPPGFGYRVAEGAMIGLFLGLSLLYGWILVAGGRA